jgi:hypothetical protein
MLSKNESMIEVAFFTSGKLRRAEKKLETMTFFPDCGGDGGTLYSDGHGSTA